jgi:small subunit ribosomal protein S2
METSNIQTLFTAGTHFGYSRTRRHPTATPYLFGTKDNSDIFNLEETAKCLDTAASFASSLAKSGKQILFVGGKNEVISIVRSAAERVRQPFVAGRWIGGSLTNLKGIRKRIERLLKLIDEREKGELEKYTKKERLLIDREIEELTERFGGLIRMTDLPAALFIVDTRHEHTAVREATQLHIPIIGLANSDCDFSLIQYPIPGNDTSIRSVRFVVETITDAIAEGTRTQTTTLEKNIPATSAAI